MSRIFSVLSVIQRACRFCPSAANFTKNIFVSAKTAIVPIPVKIKLEDTDPTNIFPISFPAGFQTFIERRLSKPQQCSVEEKYLHAFTRCRIDISGAIELDSIRNTAVYI